MEASKTKSCQLTKKSQGGRGPGVVVLQLVPNDSGTPCDFPIALLQEVIYSVCLSSYIYMQVTAYFHYSILRRLHPLFVSILECLFVVASVNYTIIIDRL